MSPGSTARRRALARSISVQCEDGRDAEFGVCGIGKSPGILSVIEPRGKRPVTYYIGLVQHSAFPIATKVLELNRKVKSYETQSGIFGVGVDQPEWLGS